MIGINNVLNIRATNSRWKGKTGVRRGFCNFDSVKSCLRVGLYLFERTYRKRGLRTIAQMIEVYAPPSDGNDTPAYIDYVSRCLGFTAFVPYANINLIGKYKLFKAMCMIETNFELKYETFVEVYNNFKNEK